MKYVYSVLFFILNTQISTGQISSSDSLYLNNIFGENTYVAYWNYPGQWFHHQELTSVQSFYNKIDSSYQFYNDEFADCYNKLSTSDILERDTIINGTINNFEINNNLKIYGNRDPFVKLKFTLNNKTAYSYALIDSSSAPANNSDIAFVIIPGTGTNLLKDIIDGTGYHDVNCHVRNLVKPLGDTYVMSMPNEDHRAIIFNMKKPTSLPSYQPPYLINYLNAENKALGLNRLIETVAFIKYLKTKYKKVFLLGLSTGGTVALWSAMLAEPDAALVASGYSVLVDNDFNSQMVNAMSYGNYLLVYDKDSTKNRLSQLHTQFLFTQAQNDNALSQLDIDSNITRNFLGSLSNISFFYNYTNHSFPPCPVIDSFVHRCMSMPKVFISTDSSICNKDSIRLHLEFVGKPPFSFDLFRNDSLKGSFVSATNNYQISLLDEGPYYFNNIKDSLQTPGYCSDTFHYIKTANPWAVLETKDFDCNTTNKRIAFEFGGTGPFTTFYTANNISDSLVFNSTKDSLWFGNGNYHFTQVRDARNCTAVVNKKIDLHNSPVQFELSSIEYDCNLNKNIVSIAVEGTFPINFTYWDDMINSFRFEIVNNNAYQFQLDSGDYFFMRLTDSNNCTLNIDTNVLIHNEMKFKQGIYKKNLQLKATNENFSTYYWFLNNQPYKETEVPFIDLIENGIYQLGNLNKFHCILKTPELKIDMGKINIYPNPVNDYVNIFLALEKKETVQASITDLSGKILYQMDLQDGLNRWTLPELPRGLYLIHFNTSFKSVNYTSQKLIKN